VIQNSNPRISKYEARMKSTFLWDVTPCSPVEVHRLFGGTYCSISMTEEQPKQETGLHFDSEDGDDMFLRNVGRHVPDYTASHPSSTLHTRRCENL
jgi:hypothetical protein